MEYIKLQREAERLKEEKKRVRLEFVRIVSHELKAPLAAIEGYLNNLLSGFAGDSEESRNKILSRCKNRAEGMRKLIQDLLDLTRVETGTKQRELQEFDLPDMLRDVLEVFEPQSQEKDVKLNFHECEMPKMRGEPGNSGSCSPTCSATPSSTTAKAARWTFQCNWQTNRSSYPFPMTA
ncbi:MAG: HAMP domain-containing sensor histidine kinase [Planctomycetota bacterium]|nr:HAMP domain-containing sensor histidine kinase [Planctomycetota bacterium]